MEFNYDYPEKTRGSTNITKFFLQVMCELKIA